MLPRGRASRLLLAGLALVALVHLGAQLADASSLADLTQVLLMPLLAAAVHAETSPPRSRLVTLTLVALGLSWLGDSAPRLVSGDAAFLVMVGFFLLAQVVYIAAFLPYRERSVLRRRRGLLLGYVAAVAGLVAACAGGAEGMLVPVLVYGGCLGTMAVLATGVNAAVAVGGALFLVSDGLIALGAFAPGFDLPVAGFWVMATYVAAQVLIAGGVLAETRRRTSPPARPEPRVSG
jgi:uncharacterized membrane protein YhhN